MSGCACTGRGWGDCFLISFSRAGANTVHMLIDCGVIVGTANPAKIMGDVVADIKSETGGHLNLVVATHEHWDHVSGYSQVKSAWDEMEVDEVWAAWTEDLSDPLAQQLRGQREQAVQALTAALTHMSAVPNAFDNYRQGIAGILGFFGIDDTAAMPAAGAAGGQKPSPHSPHSPPRQQAKRRQPSTTS